MVTVELAIGLVTAVTLTACLVGLSLLGVAQATVAESSAQIARQAARGDDASLQEARARAPRRSTIDVSTDRAGVSVTVAMALEVPGLGPLSVTSTAWAAYEPGVGP